MKKLGFGLMRLPQNDGVIDVEQVKMMVDAFISRGFTYFDTAWMYCNHESENVTRTALCERYPRERFTLATKLHSAFFNTVEEREEYFETQLKKTGAGYFDYYLIHAINKDMYKKHTELDSFSWLIEKKNQGLVKSIGFSFHDDAQFLDKVLTEHPEMEFVQLQINYLDWESARVQSRLCYETARRHGKPVIVMEPVKGGTLANVPESVEKLFKDYAPDMSAASWAVRFAASLEGVMCVLSGMSNTDQLDDNTSFMQDFKPLCDKEYEIINKAVEYIKDSKMIPCTACEYCLGGCPEGIAIPSLFALYNKDKRADSKSKKEFAEFEVKPSSCIECGACKSVCPQKLDIPGYLKTLSDFYEK